MRPRIVVVGSVNMDVVLRTPRIPGPGETVTGRSLTYTPGGKGANQAVAAARLGADVAMVARVGDDPAGAPMRENLAANGVDVSRVLVTEDTPQGIAMILVDDAGQNCIVLAAGSNGKLAPDDVEASGTAFEGAAVLLLQNEVSPETTLRAAQAGRAAGVTVIWNPAPAPERVPDGLAACVDIIVPNESEAERLTGCAVCDPGSARIAAEALMAQGFPAVVVTLGDKGAVWAGAGTVLHVPAVPVEVVDTTAAGDTFIGALGVALAEGRSPEDAMRFAAASAALATTHLGAQAGIPTRDQVESLKAED